MTITKGGATAIVSTIPSSDTSARATALAGEIKDTIDHFRRQDPVTSDVDIRQAIQLATPKPRDDRATVAKTSSGESSSESYLDQLASKAAALATGFLGAWLITHLDLLGDLIDTWLATLRDFLIPSDRSLQLMIEIAICLGFATFVWVCYLSLAGGRQFDINNSEQ